MWINLIEDEENLNFILSKYLEEEGYNVRSYLKGADVIKDMALPVDLWVIDIMLPDTNGFTLFREIKKAHPNVYTIFISARNQDIDRVVGLEMGSDDYISKPFMARELIIKINKLLKKDGTARREYINLGDYKIDVFGRKVVLGNEAVDLSTKEYDLLLFLVNNKGIVLSRSKILDEVWGCDYYGSDRVVDDTIRRVRKKIEALDIKSVYGHGYSYEGVLNER